MLSFALIMLSPAFLRLLGLVSCVVASCVLIYTTVYNMWDSFENPPPSLNVGRVDNLARRPYATAGASYANTTVSLVTLPTSSEVFVCVASAANDIATTVVVPASAFELVLEMADFHISLCDFPEVALSFANADDLRLFAASLKGVVNVGNKP
ncbi:hypothetical protein C8Q76DRAFT_795103 [Earliella scabrosa]|nr:hypothetical protein C8Q76DRAFT_795103 [Earliella scabrosa]